MFRKTGKPVVALSSIKLSICLLSLCVFHVITVQADTGNPLPAEPDQWRFTIAFPMIWAPTINGKIRGGPDADFEVSFKDILDGLEFGIMGELYANRGRFGAALRVNYMNVQSEEEVDGILIKNIGTDLNMGVNDFLATWQVHDDVRLVTGIRHVHAKMDVDVTGGLGSTDSTETIRVTDDNMYDLLFGLSYSHWFNDRWGLMLNADVGVVGDNDRDFSTEFRALYRISDLNNFWFGFRFLNIGNDSNASGHLVKVDMTQVGPTAGWAFTF
jgi:hypothetical protein